MNSLVIPALAELLLYSAPGLSAQWVQVGPGAFAGLLMAHMLIFLSPLWPAQLSVDRHNDQKPCPAKRTYIFRSQELHAFGHLVGEAQQVVGGEALVHVVWQQFVRLTVWFGKTHQKPQWDNLIFLVLQTYFEGNYCAFPSLNDLLFNVLPHCETSTYSSCIGKYSPGCWNQAFTNGKKKLDIIMCVVQLSPLCNYRPSPGLNSDQGGPLNQHWLKRCPEAKRVHGEVKAGQSLRACTIWSFLRGRVVVVRALEVRVLGGVAYLQHGHVLSVVGLLHVHVVAFALEGQDHITRRQGQEKRRLLEMFYS